MSELPEVIEAAAPAGRARLDVRARWLWMASSAGAVGVLSGAAAIGLTMLDQPVWPVAALAPVVLAFAVGYAYLHWRFWWWGTAPEALEVGRGIVIRRASYVPYHRIQQIDVHRSFLERALGLARLTVHTASATTDATIPGLALEDAQQLRRHLLTRSGGDDGV